MKQALEKFWPEMTRVVDRRISGEERPVPTPWAHMNELLGGGLWPGLHPIISSPGNGKTTFVSQIAAHAALAGFETYYASLELDETQIVLRLASALHGKLPWAPLFMGDATGRDELDRMYPTTVKGLPFTLDTGTAEGWAIEEIEKWLPETTTSDTKLVVLDYLQLANIGTGDEPRQRVAFVTKRLQDIARLNNLAIVAVSSTSRSNYDERALFQDAELRDKDAGNVGTMENRSVVMKTAKESGEVEFGATSLSSLVRVGDRTFLLIAKRRLDDGGVWCSFRFDTNGGGFITDDTFGGWGKDETPAPALEASGNVETAVARIRADGLKKVKPGEWQ